MSMECAREHWSIRRLKIANCNRTNRTHFAIDWAFKSMYQLIVLWSRCFSCFHRNLEKNWSRMIDFMYFYRDKVWSSEITWKYYATLWVSFAEWGAIWSFFCHWIQFYAMYHLEYGFISPFHSSLSLSKCLIYSVWMSCHVADGQTMKAYQMTVSMHKCSVTKSNRGIKKLK